MKAATAILGALFSGSNSLIPSPRNATKRQKNPNSAESQYLIACAEEKREKRAAKRHASALRVEAFAKEAAINGLPVLGSSFTRSGVGAYNVPEYFEARAEIAAKQQVYNVEHNPKGKNKGQSIHRCPLTGDALPQPKKVTKGERNDRRKQRAAILSLATIARLPKERNTPKKRRFKGVGTPFAKR